MTITITMTGRTRTAGSLLPIGATGLAAIVAASTGTFRAPDPTCARDNSVIDLGRLLGILPTDARRDDRTFSTHALDPLGAAV